MLSACLLSAVLVMMGSGGLAEAQIRAVDGLVTIHADKMPLNQILDRLATSSGMKVTYEGTRPSMLVSMTVDGISETEAILKLMEGQGVSYVLATDPTGERVDTLIISGAGAGRPVPPAQSAASSEPAYEEPVADYGHVPLDPAVIEAAGPQGKPDMNSPYLGLPPQHFPPGMPPQPGQPDPTGSASGTGSRGGYPNVPTGNGPVAAPSFPTGASFPTR